MLTTVQLDCTENADLFYSPVEDGRMEPDRDFREALAGTLCEMCPIRLACLEKSLVDSEYYGVWGGLGEAERRNFRTHLLHEGYDRREIPSGRELRSALVHFYDRHLTPSQKMFLLQVDTRESVPA